MRQPTLAMAEAQAAATLRLELQAAEAVVGLLPARLEELRRTLMAASAGYSGDVGVVAETQLPAAFAGVGAEAERALERFLRQAALLGAEHANEVIEELPGFVPEPDFTLASSAPGIVERALATALALAVSAVGVAGFLAVVGAAESAVHRLRAAARTGVNETHNAVGLELASQAGFGVVWVAERDGCVECLAHSGTVVESGGTFAPATFDTHPPTHVMPIQHPPLHLNCRCAIIPHHEDFGSAFADGLKREARRSVAKGWRVESESEAVRLRAAEALLRRGADLPKSVTEAARRSLARGKFPDRRVPRFP